MFKINFLYTILMFLALLSSGQHKTFKKDFDIFSKGIYLQNLELLIPWKIDYGKIQTYGDPKITKISKSSFVKIQWDSVKIINNFSVNLYIQEFRSFVSKKKIMRVREFRALIDSSIASNISTYIINLTRKSGNYVVSRKNTFTRWDVDNCKLTIGYDKRFGYFLIINNKL